MEHFLAEGQPLQIASSDAGVVADWLRDKTSLSVKVPQGDPDGARLLGGRKCKIGGETAAFAVYKVGNEPVSFVALPEPDDVLAEMEHVNREGHTFWIDRCKGHTILACRRGKLVYAMVSRLPEEAMMPLMEDTPH